MQSSHIWQCQDITYDEEHPSLAQTPSQGLPTMIKTFKSGDCTPTRGTIFTTSFQGYDVYGNPVASVDALGAANSPLYASSGCTLSTAPVIMSVSYDYTQGSLPTSATDVNGQTTSTSYSYDSSGNHTVQVALPLHTGS
jgi:hypothetical protein